MYKKIFAIMMAAAMMLTCLAGCGNDKPASSATIKIGGIGPLTGDAATYGIATKQGAEIAVAEINAKGGLQIEFKAEDDVSDNEKATTAYATLMDWGMQFFAGAVTTGPCLTLAPKAAADNLFMMTPYYYKTSIEDKKKLESLTTLETEIAFSLQIIQKC